MTKVISNNFFTEYFCPQLTDQNFSMALTRSGNQVPPEIASLLNERSFELMSEATDISVTDVSGVIIYANQNFADTTGHALEEIIGGKHSIINSGHHSNHFWSSMWNTILAGKTWEGIIKNVKKNGQHYWVNTKIFPILNDQKEVVAFLSFRSDITETKVYESLLKESESKLKALYDSNPDAYILVSQDKRVIYYNKSAKKIIHRLTGKKIKPNKKIEKLVQDYRHIDWSALNKELPSKEIKRTAELIFKDGNREWHAIIHRAVYNDEKDFIGTSITFRNIHKEKIAEDAVQQSQKKYANLYNNTPSMYFTLDENGIIKSLNEYGARTLGYSVEELLEQHVSVVVDEAFRTEATRKLNECILSPEITFNWQLQKITKGGEYLWVKETAWAHKNEMDELQINIICEDITHKRKSEEKLKQLNERLTALIEAIPDAIFFKDGDSRWLITNEAAKKLFQLHNIDWVGKTEMELAELRPEFKATHESCFGGDEMAWEAQKLIMVKETIMNESGELREFEVRKMPIFNEDGSRKALVIIGTDVTERNQIENELRDEHNLFMGGPTIIFKWENKTGWPVAYVSDNVLKQLGYLSEELIGTPFSDIIHPKDLKRVTDEIESHLATNKSSFGQTYRVRTKDGLYRWLYDYIYVKRNEEGVPTMFFSYANDVTEKLASEKKIILQNERLLGIAWLFSHEVRGPVARIKGLANIFNYSNSSDPINGEVLNRLQEPANDLDKIISAIVNQTYELKMEDEILDHNIAHKE